MAHGRRLVQEGKTGLGYEGVAPDGNLTVQNSDIPDHAPQQ